MIQYRNQPDIEDLISQLNPHFINNAFQWLQLRLKGDEQATTMITRLAENFSMVFNKQAGHYALHTLAEELKLIDNYLYIQQCRYGDKLNFDMPEKAQWHRYQYILVPMSFVLPMVEAAVEDRIRRGKDGRGRLTISLTEVGDGVKMSIEDDGIVDIRSGDQPCSKKGHAAWRSKPESKAIQVTCEQYTMSRNRGTRVMLHFKK